MGSISVGLSLGVILATLSFAAAARTRRLFAPHDKCKAHYDLVHVQAPHRRMARLCSTSPFANSPAVPTF
ncbi:hypothetical protein ACFZAR_35760 [Streptomyces sp. NPDC008222]|uniref:hypothetical protein n=1 Tax=Streptomyces sp. NPDC008222 TaxID=3364820 RepID=UPI0036F0C88A